MNATSFVGRWNILSWEQRYEDGRHALPLGSQLEGFIHYTANGEMMCMIARKERPKFTTGGQWDASADEKARAYDSMLAYAGRYSVEGNEVIHHVDISLFPGWKGGQQRRKFDFHGEQLELSGLFDAGTSEARTAVLRWTRA